MTKLVWIPIALLLVAAFVAGPACAEAADLASFEEAVAQVGDAACAPLARAAAYRPAALPRRSDWRFLIAPYAWLAGVNGTVVAEGVETEVDVPFSDLSERANGGFQLYSEVRWKKWFVAFDGTWANLGDSAGGRLLELDVTIRQRIFDIRIGHQILRCSRDGALDPCCEYQRRWFAIDGFVGVRYWYTRSILMLTGFRGRVWKSDEIDERWDPFVGLRLGFDITRRLGIGLRGDVGGFGLGGAAEFAWQAQVGFRIDLTRWMHLIAGYRAIHFDTIEGSGAQRSGQALTQHGPLIGLGFSF